MDDFSSQNPENPIMAYLLDHDYSAQNLSFDNLKNGDFAKVSVLLQAAQKNDCLAFLCLVTYQRSSYGDVQFYGRHSYHAEIPVEEPFQQVACY